MQARAIRLTLIVALTAAVAGAVPLEPLSDPGSMNRTSFSDFLAFDTNAGPWTVAEEDIPDYTDLRPWQLESIGAIGLFAPVPLSEVLPLVQEADAVLAEMLMDTQSAATQYILTPPFELVTNAWQTNARQKAVGPPEDMMPEDMPEPGEPQRGLFQPLPWAGLIQVFAAVVIFLLLAIRQRM
jgi:hypothetical protein